MEPHEPIALESSSPQVRKALRGVRNIAKLVADGLPSHGCQRILFSLILAICLGRLLGKQTHGTCLNVSAARDQLNFHVPFILSDSGFNMPAWTVPDLVMSLAHLRAPKVSQRHLLEPKPLQLLGP